MSRYTVANDASGEPLRFELSNFVDNAASPAYFTDQNTRVLPSNYSSSASVAPNCFYNNLFPALIPTQIERLFETVASFFHNSNRSAFDEFRARGSFKNCAVCHCPSPVKRSLSMRFDFGPPVDTPSSLPGPPGQENLFKFQQLRRFYSLENRPFTTAFWMVLNCSNARLCPDSPFNYSCCIRHLNDVNNPSTLQISSADMVQAPSSTENPSSSASFSSSLHNLKSIFSFADKMFLAFLIRFSVQQSTVASQTLIIFLINSRLFEWSVMSQADVMPPHSFMTLDATAPSRRIRSRPLPHHDKLGSGAARGHEHSDLVSV